MLFWDRLRTSLASMQYREFWQLPRPLMRTMGQALQSIRPVFLDGKIYLHLYAPPIGGASYGRYLNGLKRLADGERLPLVVHIAITDECQHSCRRCSNRATGKEPTIQEVTELLKDFRQAGTVHIAFTGGEPTLRDDFPDIIQSCSADTSTLLYTSGEKLDLSMAKRLKSAGLEMAYISLDHYEPAIHDSGRGTKGAFQQACSAISACLKAGIYTAAQAVVDGDLLEADKMKRYLEFCAGLGVNDVMLLTPVNVWEENPPTVHTEEQTAELAAWQPRAAKDVTLPKVTVQAFMESAGMFGCQAGYTFLYVNTAGEVYPCDYVPRSLGNACDLGVPTILERMQECVKTPSCNCMASPDTSSELPCSWEKTAQWFKSYQSGPPPYAMRWLNSRKDNG